MNGCLAKFCIYEAKCVQSDSNVAVVISFFLVFFFFAETVWQAPSTYLTAEEYSAKLASVVPTTAAAVPEASG